MSEVVAPNVLLARILGNHFPGAVVEEDTVDLNLAGIRVRCEAHPDASGGSFRNVSLFFWLTGGPWEERSIFASASGYGPTVQDAIVTGGCNWGCTVAPVLRGALDPASNAEPARRQVSHDGAEVVILVEALDRSFGSASAPLPADFLAQVRTNLAGNDLFLAPLLFEADVLPVLPARPTLLSVFIAEAADRRIVEVKLDGTDWPFASRAFTAPPSVMPGMAMLRELALIVPNGPTPLTREAIERTLDGLASVLGEHRRPAVDWRGWDAHGGLLDPPMTDGDIEDLEAAIGPLPADYRRFLAEVAEGGAGPGFGLLSPDHSAQVRLAHGRFREDAPLAGAIALAHAGCAVTWFLVLEGAHRGEVWVDADSSSGGRRSVAPSFEAWYRDWLDSAIGVRGPWLQWDRAGCAPSSAIAQRADGFQGDPSTLLAGAQIGLKAGGGWAFHEGDPVDPCEGCEGELRRLGMVSEDIARGTAPIQGR